jgi:hypothetical protein
MRDPGLVQRAEQAALALERAWDYWRSQRGVGAEKPTPVSSYVGYSLEEPWGEPRVVFGLGAEEAEMLAAVIIGHEYVGPVHADLTDWPRAAGNESAPPAAPQVSSDDRVAVPVQAGSPSESARSADEAVEPAEVAGSAGHQLAGRQRADREPAKEQADRQSQLVEPLIEAMRPGGEHETIPAEIVPLEELVPLPAAETDGRAYRAASQRTGNGGPRYQGSPPQYQANGAQPDSEVVASGDTAAQSVGDQPDRAAPLVVSKAGPARRSQRNAHETRARAHEQEREPTKAADPAV